MKTIKSVLACALVALLGSSVWAVEETIPANFASGGERMTRTKEAASETTWYAWSESNLLVSVTIAGGTKAEGTPDDKVEFTGKAATVTLQLVPNAKKGNTTVHLTNKLGDEYTFPSRIDLVQCTSFELKHCADEDDPQAWREIDPAKYPALVPDEGKENWGFAHAYSLDEGIAKIKVVDGKFRLYAPADGKDGTTRCIFIKDENDVLENDAKIYMFYVTVSTVELEKWLTFPEDEEKAQSNATLNIRAHYLNNVKEDITPKVLFVGSGCTSHDLAATTIVQSVGVILEKADVDVYLYKKGDAWDAQSSVYLPLKKGDPFATSDLKDRRGQSWSMSGSNHNCLNAFYDLFYSIASDEKKRYQYDYIVMEFDGSRLASSAPTDYSNRRRDIVVAEWLNEYYEGRKDSDNARVVWVVDNDASGYIKKWDGANYFRPCSAYSSDGQKSRGNLNYGQFRGLLGILNPWTCLENKLFDYNYSSQSAALQSAIDAVCPKISMTIYDSDGDASVGEKYAHQANYNNLTALKEFLAKRIVVTSYSANITDNVETQGLSFVSSPVIYGTYDTNTAGNVNIKNWSDLTKTTAGMKVTGTVKPDTDHNSISGHVDNVTKEFWAWIQIGLEDNGDFRGGAKWDADKKKFFRDPNLNTNRADVVHGEAAYTYFYDITDPKNGVEAEATTLASWPFDKLPLEIKAAGVTRVYNGNGTNATVVSVKSGGTDVTDATITAIYSSDEGKTWSEPEDFAQEKFVNVTNLQVKLIAYKSEYYFTATSDYVTVEIKKRPVMLEAKSAAKIYEEGNPLTESGFNIVPSDDSDVAKYPDYGFVGSDGVKSVSMTSASKQVDAGECANQIEKGSEVAKDGTILSNYEFLYRDGKLGVVSALPYEAIYDGQGHSIALQLGNISGSPTIEYSWDGESDWSGSDSNKVHVTSGTALYYKVNLGYAQTGVGSSTITITQRVVTVYANETNKVYGVVTNSAGEVTGVKPDPVFSWHADLSSAEEIDEENEVLAALLGDADAPTNNLKRVAEDAATQAKYGPETNMEDVLYRNPTNYKHYAVITTNEPFRVIIDTYEDYRVEFVPGDFKIFPTNCAFASESGTFDYVGIYDGAPHTIDLIVLPGEDGLGRKTTVSFSTNEVDWTEPIPYDEEKKWRSVMPTYTHVTNKAPVYVKAENLPNLYETNMVAYVTITQRIVYVTADSDSKVYDGTALTVDTATIDGSRGHGFVTGEGFGVFTMTDDSTITNVGSTNNVISSYTFLSNTQRGDYIIIKDTGTLTISPSPIEEVPEGKDPGDDPWAQATSVIVWTNNVPEVWTTGTNILVDVGLFTEADTAAAKRGLKFTFENPANFASFDDWAENADFMGDAAIKDELKGLVCSTQVWCLVSCENYLPTNVTAWVSILSKESEVIENPKNKDEDRLQNREDLEKQAATIVDSMLEYLPDGTKNPDYNKKGSKNYNPDLPAWDANTLDAKIELVVTSQQALKGQEAIAAEEEVQKVLKSSLVNGYESVKTRLVDVSLWCTRQMKTGPVDPIDIGAGNKREISFTLPLNLEEGEVVIGVVAYHDGVKASSSPYYAVAKDRKSITIKSKKFSHFIIVTGIKERPICPVCPFGYQIKVALRTTKAVSVSNELACTELCLRMPSTKRLAGFIYGYTDEIEGLCGEGGCECNAWTDAKLLLWDYDTHESALPEAASIQLVDRIVSPRLDSSVVEFAFRLDEIQFAGFGLAAKRNGQWTIHDLTGFCAGYVGQSCKACAEQACGECLEWGEEVPPSVWTMCASENLEPNAVNPNTLVYGKWTIDWSPTVYNRADSGKSMIPDGWAEMEPLGFSVE